MFTRNHLAKMLRQQIEQGELRAGQFQRLTIEAGFLAAGVQAQGSTSSVGELFRYSAAARSSGNGAESRVYAPPVHGR
jgi:hypothetical protein